MSRWGGPRGGDDLAYGDAPPQRWDRDTFERFGRGGPASPPQPQYQEDYRYQERDRPGMRDIAVADRIETRGPPGRFEERGRFAQDNRFGSGGAPRRSDRELFGDVDPRELAGMSLMPYRAKSNTRRDSDFEQRSAAPPPPRPGQLIRRQSSLDTFDRRPRYQDYDKQDYRMPPYTPVPLPIRRDRRYEDDIQEDTRYHNYEPEDYREVEIQRERSVHRRVPKSHKSGKSV